MPLDLQNKKLPRTIALGFVQVSKQPNFKNIKFRFVLISAKFFPLVYEITNNLFSSGKLHRLKIQIEFAEEILKNKY